MHATFLTAVAPRGLLAAAGGSLTESEWVARVVYEIGRSQIREVHFETVKGAVLGTLAGVALAILAFRLFRRLGWYDSSWRFARALRAGLLTVTMMLAGVFLGNAGFWNGHARAAQSLLAKSQLGVEVLPYIGDLTADALMWLQLRSPALVTMTRQQVSAQLQAFRAGERELDAAAFRGQLDRFEAEAVSEVFAELERYALDRAPEFSGGLAERLIRQILTSFGTALARNAAAPAPQQWGGDRLLTALRADLAAEAAMNGDPDTIRRSELSDLVVREGILPGVLTPIRAYARDQQAAFALLALAIVLIPPVTLRLFHRSAPLPTFSQLREKAARAKAEPDGTNL